MFYFLNTDIKSAINNCKIVTYSGIAVVFIKEGFKVEISGVVLVMKFTIDKIFEKTRRPS